MLIKRLLILLMLTISSLSFAMDDNAEPERMDEQFEGPAQLEVVDEVEPTEESEEMRPAPLSVPQQLLVDLFVEAAQDNRLDFIRILRPRVNINAKHSEYNFSAVDVAYSSGNAELLNLLLGE